MSTLSCQADDTTGFPLKVAYPIHSNWPSSQNTQSELQKKIVPTDFTLNWGANKGKLQSITITVNQTPTIFQIRGINIITDNTTLAYGNASYVCSSVLSIVKNQHINLNDKLNTGLVPLYELILAFQIANKSDNPSSPDIILLTRPIVFSSTNTPSDFVSNTSSDFLSAVDIATASTTKSKTTPLDMSTLFGYDSSTLLPMVSYQTCLPVKLTNTNESPYTSIIGSMRMRVNVVRQPLYVNGSANGLGLCSTINKYTLVTEPRRLVDIFLYNFNNQIFGGITSNVYIQFKDGLGTDGYPTLTSTNKENNLKLLLDTPSITALSDLTTKIIILIPETFIGKSLAQIANSTTPPKTTSKKKAFKCYTIDPSRDIVGDQIMVDPTTGQSLKDTMQQNAEDAAGGDAVKQLKYYTMYGTDITGTINVLNTFPVTGQDDLTAFIAQDGPRVRIVYANLSDPSYSIGSRSYLGDYSILKSNNDINKKLLEMIPNTEPYDYQISNNPDDVKINVITVNSLLDSQTSGILPGDIERMLVTICVVISSILLFAYLSFIAYKIFVNPNLEPFPYFHIFLFIILLILLSLFGVYVDKGEAALDPNKNGAANALDPNKNGIKK